MKTWQILASASAIATVVSAPAFAQEAVDLMTLDDDTL